MLLVAASAILTILGWVLQFSLPESILGRVAFALAIAAAWWRVAPQAWAGLRALRADMNVLMSVAVVGAVGIGEWLEASTVACLFALAHLLESWSIGRADHPGEHHPFGPAGPGPPLAGRTVCG